MTSTEISIDYASLVLTFVGGSEVALPYGLEFASPFFVDHRLFSVFKTYDDKGRVAGWSACPGILPLGATKYPTRREACVEFLKRSELVRAAS